MGNKLFDQINAVWESDTLITTKTKPDSIYMTNRFLSLNPDGFVAAVNCNRMIGLPEWAALSFLKYATSKRVPPRNKYPKKLVGPTLTDQKKLTLKRVCKKFNVTDTHGLQIVKLLEQQGIILDAN